MNFSGSPYYLAFVLLIAIGWSQDSNAYDLEEAFRIASAIDSQTASAKSSRDAAHERSNDVLTTFYPQINITAGRIHNASRISGIPGVTDGDQSFFSNSLSINATQPIYNRLLSLIKAEGALQAGYEEIQIEQTTNDLIIRLSQLLLDYYHLKMSVSEYKDEIELLTKIEGMTNSNSNAISEHFVVKQRLIEAETQEAIAKNQLSQKEMALIQIVGRLPANSIKFSISPLSSENLPSLGELRQKTAIENLGVKFSAIFSSITDVLLKKILANRYPTVDLIVNLTHAEGMQYYTGAAIQAATIGIQATIPITSSLSDSSKIKEASFMINKAQYDLETARRTALQNLMDLYFEFKNTNILIDAGRKRLAIENDNTYANLSDKEISILKIEREISVIQANRDLRRLTCENVIQFSKILGIIGYIDGNGLSQINRLMNIIR